MIRLDCNLQHREKKKSRRRMVFKAILNICLAQINRFLTKPWYYDGSRRRKWL